MNTLSTSIDKHAGLYAPTFSSNPRNIVQIANTKVFAYIFRYHKWLPGIELLTLWATVLGVNGFVSVRYVLLVRNQYAGIIYYWRGQARKGAAPAIID